MVEGLEHSESGKDSVALYIKTLMVGIKEAVQRIRLLPPRKPDS